MSERAWAELSALAAERNRAEPHRPLRATPGFIARGLLETQLEQLAAKRAGEVERRAAETAKAVRRKP